ncbi:hypothetical protein DFH08DRAFT_713341, partial [Mycena albidolilacea]
CIVFVLVQLLPPKSPLIHCCRKLLQFRMMGGLKGMTESRIKVIKTFISTYEYWCTEVSKVYGKKFRFPKQHFVVHAVQDILSKGVLWNATTRTGEGFHQEIAQHYTKTNCREAEEQIAGEDEDQEVVARTRLIVDDFFRHLQGEDVDDNEAKNTQTESAQFHQQSGRRIPKSKILPASCNNHWIFGSALRRGDSRSYEDLYAASDPIEIFRCVYITFQYKDDWTKCEDILCCNNNWYNSGPQYDCVLYNKDTPGLACARLCSLVRCKLPSGRIVDLAIVQTMWKSGWCPCTTWDGCAVYDEEKNFSFLLMDYVIRGALLVLV